MVNDFQEIFVFSLTLKDIIGNIIIAMICGLSIAILYRYTYRGLNYSSAFTISLIMLTMITAVVIMVIGNNLARAFGLVGAMSIIRFRTAVKDASDIMFIFFALTVGLASGVKLYAVAIFGTVFIGLVYLVIIRFSFALPKTREYLIQINIQSEILPDDAFSSIFKKFSSKYKLVNVKTIGEDSNQIMEFSYYIKLRRDENSTKMLSSIKKIPGVVSVNLFFDEV